MRDDFSKPIKELLARRVGFRCSNPACRQPTVGPQANKTKTTNVGVAAHITAASPDGPRYEPQITAEERQAYENGIWLCQNHAKLADDDEQTYTVFILRGWKSCAENSAARELEQGSYEYLEGKVQSERFRSQSNKSIFTRKENTEFEYIFNELNELIRVSATNSHKSRKGWWNIKVSILELLLRCYYENSQSFGGITNLNHREIFSESENGIDTNFHLDINSWDMFDPRPLLIKFDLINATRDRYYLHKYTRRMQRFVFWMEYNKFNPSKSVCAFEEFK